MSEESLDTLCNCVAANENIAIDDNEFKRAVIELLCPTIFESQQNLALYSEEFTNGVYTGASTQVADAIAGPFPGTLADRIDYDATTTFNRFNQNGITTTTGTWSIGDKLRVLLTLKKGNFQYLWCGFNGDAQWHGGVCDLDAGTFTGSTFSDSAVIENLGNGWYTITLEFTFIGGPASVSAILNWSDSDPNAPSTALTLGTEFVYLFRYQVQNISDVNYSTAYLTTTDTKLTIP